MKKVLFLILVLISLIILGIRLISWPLNNFFFLKEKAGLRVLSTPVAQVLIDNNEVGKTPFEDSNLESKEYTIKVQSVDGAWEGKVKLRAGTLTVVNRELSKDLSSSAGEILTLEEGNGVTIISTPDNADVEIDGKGVGKTPLLAQIESKEHTFVISHSRYLKRSIKALIPENFNLGINVDLALAEADLTAVVIPPITATQTVVVKSTPTGFLRVRDKASLIGKEVAQVKPGDELVLLEELPSWNRVRLSNGKEGYVASSYVVKK